jgi:hypothetical protein
MPVKPSLGINVEAPLRRNVPQILGPAVGKTAGVQRISKNSLGWALHCSRYRDSPERARPTDFGRHLWFELQVIQYPPLF